MLDTTKDELDYWMDEIWWIKTINWSSKKACWSLPVLEKPNNWVQSYVMKDKIYCNHEAENEDAIREHVARGNIPTSKIREIKTIISSATARKSYA